MTFEAFPATPPDTLHEPIATVPAAGVCLGRPEDIEIVAMVLRPDVPQPRCLEVHGSQRLRIVNERAGAVQLVFAAFELDIPAGQGRLLELPFEEYLEPGIHVVTVDGAPFGEVWLKPE